MVNVSVQVMPIIRTSACVISSLLHQRLKLMPFISWRAKTVDLCAVALHLTYSDSPTLFHYLSASLCPSSLSLLFLPCSSSLLLHRPLLLCWLINGRPNALSSTRSSLGMVGTRLGGPIMHRKEDKIGRSFSESAQGKRKKTQFHNMQRKRGGEGRRTFEGRRNVEERRRDEEMEACR